MPSSSSQWNPYSVLKIDKSRTICYGWAPSQGRKCHNPVAQANRQEAERLLCKMSKLDPGSTNLDAWLQELAHRILCKRNHQGQATSVVSQWKDNIEEYLGTKEEAEEEDEGEDEIEAEIARLREIQARRRRTAVTPRIETPVRALPRQSINTIPTLSSWTSSLESSIAHHAYLDAERSRVDRQLISAPSSRRLETPPVRVRPTNEGYDAAGRAAASQSFPPRREQVPSFQDRISDGARQQSPPGEGVSSTRNSTSMPSTAPIFSPQQTIDSLRQASPSSRFDYSQPASPELHRPWTPAPSLRVDGYSTPAQTPIRSRSPEISAPGTPAFFTAPQSPVTTSPSLSPLATHTNIPSASLPSLPSWSFADLTPPPSRAVSEVPDTISSRHIVEANPPTPRSTIRHFGTGELDMTHQRPWSFAALASEGQSSEAASDTESTVSEPAESTNSATNASTSQTTGSEPATSLADETPIPSPIPAEPRSISGDCSICYDSLLDGNCLVSCRAQCKQYFHGNCIKTWLQEDRRKRCPYWYVDPPID